MTAAWAHREPPKPAPPPLQTARPSPQSRREPLDRAAFRLDPMLSWQEFLDTARSPATLRRGHARRAAAVWAGATWDEAQVLATDGWHRLLRYEFPDIADLRHRTGLSAAELSLEPVWDVTGAEVDLAAYLAGEPDCMLDTAPRRVSRRGKVVSFLIPASYSHNVSQDAVRNRGLALATLCTAIVEAGHSVEVWSGFACQIWRKDIRCSAVARVISAGEPLDLGRLIFAVAHPAMLRRLWLAVWDAQPEPVAKAMLRTNYGVLPFTCVPEDLPAEITDPYVFPYLHAEDRQWRTLETALAWCRELFVELGITQQEGR